MRHVLNGLNTPIRIASVLGRNNERLPKERRWSLADVEANEVSPSRICAFTHSIARDHDVSLLVNHHARRGCGVETKITRDLISPGVEHVELEVEVSIQCVEREYHVVVSDHIDEGGSSNTRCIPYSMVMAREIVGDILSWHAYESIEALKAQ